MEYYKPLIPPAIRFVYDKVKKNVSIQPYINVPLNAGETLALVSEAYTDATKTIMKEFRHADDASLVSPYVYVDHAAVEIIRNVTIPYDERYVEDFKKKLRATFAAEYIVKTVLNPKPDGSAAGGQVTNTITNSGEIVII
jgi:hypothetical protein